MKIDYFHKKYPFVESIFIFLLGALIGFFSNLFTGDILSVHAENWRFVDSWYLWVIIVLIIIGVVYYWKFSAFSIAKQQNRNLQNAADIIINTLANEPKKIFKSNSPISYEKRLTLVKKVIQTMREVDTKLSGGASNDEQ